MINSPKPEETRLYKNWQAIVSIGDSHFKWAMALLDLNTDFGQKIAKQLPEYFTDKQLSQVGPIPLSAIYILAEEYARDRGSCGDTDCLVSFGERWQKRYPIPILSFSTIPNNTFDVPLLPAEIDKQMEELGRRVEVGDIFTWEGKSIVVLENNDSERGSCFLIEFAPAELIHVDWKYQSLSL